MNYIGLSGYVTIDCKHLETIEIRHNEFVFSNIDIISDNLKVIKLHYFQLKEISKEKVKILELVNGKVEDLDFPNIKLLELHDTKILNCNGVDKPKYYVDFKNYKFTCKGYLPYDSESDDDSSSSSDECDDCNSDFDYDYEDCDYTNNIHDDSLEGRKLKLNKLESLVLGGNFYKTKRFDIIAPNLNTIELYGGRNTNYVNFPFIYTDQTRLNVNLAGIILDDYIFQMNGDRCSYLDIYACSSFGLLRDPFKNFKNIEHLVVRNTKKFGDTMQKLKKLKHLELYLDCRNSRGRTKFPLGYDVFENHD